MCIMSVTTRSGSVELGGGAMRLSDFIEQSNRASSTDSIRALMERAAGDIGFDRYAYSALTGHDRYDAGDNPPPAVAHNFPPAWIDYYFERDYQGKDPVVLFAHEIESPFLWAYRQSVV